ncbi:archaellin/type IV pilin N-terminal domain-containing protein [Halostagnicola kamekurae]|uniref:Flagellin n=1 Tax=Halostagnicola kamekurae TaxID=619731 RepID=A0A1I6RK41_9EURY|nr:archaellin/type IV pilin N-terminal domain-containing protein [Halostagnicola kamekurae]SFS65062.1 flagellin FlaB [Halostagnicola kamekurae]
MFETVSDGDRRAQVGIGTLVLFVAMVLVAALTAGVLMGTAGVLQSQAEATGQESIAQVSNSLNIYTTTGTVDADGNVDTLEMTVSLGPGSKPIDLDNAVIDYVGPSGSAYVNGMPVTVHGTDSTILEDDDDRGTITLDIESKVGVLEPGDEAIIKIVTNDGAQITTELSVPTTLDGADGDTVRL